MVASRSRSPRRCSRRACRPARRATREARPDKTDVVGTWLRDASIAGDTGTVLYGNADLLLTAHLPPGTDQLWSLPSRALDPRLIELNQQLNGPHPPTWVVGWFPLDTWGLDPEHRVLATLSLRYRVVIHDLRRPDLPAPRPCTAACRPSRATVPDLAAPR